MPGTLCGVTGTGLLGSWCSHSTPGALSPALCLSLPRASAKAGGATHAQPLPPVGDPCSEGVRQVAEVLVAGAQHPAGSVPVGTWNPARPRGT